MAKAPLIRGGRHYGEDLKIWATLTDTPVTKRGLALQYACWTIDKLYDVVHGIANDQVECEKGLTNVLHVLDNFYGSDYKKSAVESSCP